MREKITVKEFVERFQNVFDSSYWHQDAVAAHYLNEKSVALKNGSAFKMSASFSQES